MHKLFVVHNRCIKILKIIHGLIKGFNNRNTAHVFGAGIIHLLKRVFEACGVSASELGFELSVDVEYN